MLKNRQYRDLWRLPARLTVCVENKCTKHEKLIVNYADYFEYHLRLYVIGVHKTLHRVSYENKCFRELDSVQASIEIIGIFETLKNELLEKEYYELMKKFLHAERLVLK